MKWLSGFLSLIWRFWFLISYIVPFTLVMPITIFFTFNDKHYPYLYWFLHRIAKIMLFVSGISMKKEHESKIDYNEQFIYCSNHTSTLDVVMMFALSKKPIAFIGKKSLSKMPFFGYYYKSTNVLVDRSNLRNAYAAYQKAGEKINAGQNMAIYPEGGIPNENIRLAKFKNGPFKLAIEQKVKIIPITFGDNKKIFPGSFLKGRPGIARLTIHKPVETNGMNEEDINKLKTHIFELIDSKLIEYENAS